MNFHHRRAQAGRRLELPPLGRDKQRNPDTGGVELLDKRREMIVLPGGIEPALGGPFGAFLRDDAGRMRPGLERDASSSRIWRRSSRRCAVMPSAPAAMASLAARTGSGWRPPRALRIVAT
jgi:hypothetical protein